MTTRIGRVTLALLAGAALTTLAACEGRPRAAPQAVATEGPRQPRTGPAIAVIDLSSGAPEQAAQSLFAGARHHSFYDLMEELELAARSPSIKGFVVRFGSASIGLARGEELSKALAAVRETKPVFCHAEGYTNATLYIAARGCSSIDLSPAGAVDAVGIAAQVVYMRKLLADELHLDIDFLQVGRFKGAEEPLTRDGPSDEARASLEGTLSDIRDSSITGLRTARKDAPEASHEDGPYAPQRAKELHLVDDVKYFDETKDAARKATGAIREEIRFGPGALGGGREGDLADVVRVLAGENDMAPVALIRATGAISMQRSGSPFGGSGGITEHDLGRIIARVERDDDIKVLVLRIDSPGGSALASDLLWHELMRVRAKKPIVVSIGEMAASGGYYLASTGTTIYAQPTSIVGSIGVVGGKIGFGKALERIGVHAETFAAKKGDAKAGARAAYDSPLVAWDAETKTRVFDTMKGIYDLFLDRVVEGRGATKLPRGKLEESAEGRIFSGREGKTRGLVDEIGGLTDALAAARSLAGLPPDAAVMILAPKLGLFDALMGGSGGASEGGEATEEAARRVASAARGPTLFDAANELAPDLMSFAQTMAPMLKGERALTALPFALIIR